MNPNLVSHHVETSYKEPFNLFIIKGFWIITFVLTVIAILLSLSIDPVFSFIPFVFILVMIISENKVMKKSGLTEITSLPEDQKKLKEITEEIFSKYKNGWAFGSTLIMVFVSLIFIERYIEFGIFLRIIIPAIISFFKLQGSIRIYFFTH